MDPAQEISHVSHCAVSVTLDDPERVPNGGAVRAELRLHRDALGVPRRGGRAESRFPLPRVPVACRQVQLESRDVVPCADEKKLETVLGGVTPEPLDLLGDVTRRDRVMARFLAWCRTHGS